VLDPELAAGDTTAEWGSEEVCVVFDGAGLGLGLAGGLGGGLGGGGLGLG